jgi:alpha-beta hydrolase superfamily lysophospholipase
VHFLERRGSGLNPQARGDVPDWRVWLTDLDEFMHSLPDDRPRILLGISWGGMLASAAARNPSFRLDGLGLICPGLFSRKAANLLQRTALRGAAAIGLRGLRVTIPLQDPGLFTNSDSGQAYIARDPLTLRKMTIRMALANLRLTACAVEAPETIRVPTLLMLAGQDPITINSQVREFVAQISHPQRRVIEYANASHTLELEDDPSPYFNDLAGWCREVAESTL